MWGPFVKFYPLSRDWMRLIELWFFAQQKLTKARVKNTRSLWDRKKTSSQFYFYYEFHTNVFPLNDNFSYNPGLT